MINLEIKNNFVSIVTLGHFNPAILNKDFLEENNILKFEKDPKITLTPIVCTVDYKNLKIIVDLERFQIVENNILNFESNLILDFVYSYLDVLKYTPINTMGINFNFIITVGDLNKIYNSEIWKKISESFKVKSCIFSVTKLIENDVETIKRINFGFDLLDFKSLNILIESIEENSSVVNFNFEIKNITKDNRFYLKDNFKKILNYHNNFKNILQKGTI